MSRCPHCGESHSADNHFCPTNGGAIDLGPRLVGQNLLEKYKVATILGEGPIGVVVEVEKIETGEHFAAKVIHPQYLTDERAVSKLISEAMESRKLTCSSITRVVDAGREKGGASVVVRELMSGQSLDEYLEDRGHLPVSEACAVAIDVIAALKTAHDAGMVNLDLSPTDIFLDESTGRRSVKVVDFGESLIKPGLYFEKGEEPESIKYCAPEQSDPDEKADKRADVYAAGAILYHMLTGTPPARIPAPANSIRTEISPKLAAVVQKAMAAAPENRYQNAGEFINAIKDADPVFHELVGSIHELKRSSGIPVRRTTPPPPRRSSTPPKTSSPPPRRSSPPPKGDSLSSRPPSSSKVPAVPRKRATVPDYTTPTGSDNELRQPSVIVDMPEVRGVGVNKKVYWAAGVVVILVVAGMIAFLTGTGENDEDIEKTKNADVVGRREVTITILANPSNARVSVDGKHLDGQPPSLKVVQNDELHTVKATAVGFESFEKDIRFDRDHTVEINLVKTVLSRVSEIDSGEKSESVIEEITEPASKSSQITDVEPAPRVVGPRKASQKKQSTPPSKSAPAGVPKQTTPVKETKPDKQAPAKQEKSEPKPVGKEKKKGGFDTSNPYG